MEKQLINYIVSPLGGTSYVASSEQKAITLAKKINASRNIYVSVWSSDPQPRLIIACLPKKES